jgi:hypothetical protein
VSHILRRPVWRRWLKYPVIALCLAGVALTIVPVIRHTNLDAPLKSRLILRGVFLLAIALIAGLDWLFPKGRNPGTS